MLQLYDISHNKLCALTDDKLKDYYLEQAVNILDHLYFSYPILDANFSFIQEEGFVCTPDNEYVIKEINLQGSDTGIEYAQIVADVNIEDIQGARVDNFEAVEQTAEDSTNLALVGTGWIVGSSDVTRLRTVRKTQVSSWDVLAEIQSAFNCEMEFDTVGKHVNIYQQRGQDRGVYFAEQLNLKQLNVQGSSRDYVTCLIPLGKDGLTIADVNGGQDYIVNHQYSNKNIFAYWSDNRYTVVQNLYDDAVKRLAYMSMPVIAYSVSIIDLANVSGIYSSLDYDLGDGITLLSASKSIRIQERIVKINRYPLEPERSTCEIANRIASLDALNVRFDDTSDTVDNVTTSDGMVDGSKVSCLPNANLGIVTTQSLTSVLAILGTAIITKLDTTDLTAINAQFTNLTADKADFVDLTAATSRIGTLEVHSETVDTLLAGNISAGNLAAGAIQAGSAVIAIGAIGDAQILSISAVKIDTGTLDTSKVDIASPDGRLLITDNSMLIYDYANQDLLQPYLRVQTGKIFNIVGGVLTPRQVSGRNVYGFEVRDVDGTTVMIDGQGVHNEGITNGAINNAKVAPDAAINGTKLDIASVVLSINGGTTTIDSSKVLLNNQTLDVAFNNSIILAPVMLMNSSAAFLTGTGNKLN